MVKEFGLYPPGPLVKPASGEVAVRRGTSGNRPFVSAVMNRRGDALGSPIRRDMTTAGRVIKGLAAMQVLRAKLAPTKPTTVATRPERVANWADRPAQ